MAPFASYTRMLFVVMAFLAVLAVSVARYVQVSWIGRGLRAIRDSEEAAECVPTLKLKLFACTVSGALMGAAGAPMPMYLSFVEPASSFSLNWGVSALAMPMIGGTAHWIGPVVGALLLGSIQQTATVTISSEINVLVVGCCSSSSSCSRPTASSGCSGNGSAPQGRKPVEAFRRVHGSERREPRDPQGERFGLIGPNGSGKTTLNCISGALWNDSGSIRFQGSEISKLPAYRRTRLGIARSFQIPRPFHSMSLLENLLVPSAYVVHLREGRGRGDEDPGDDGARRQGGAASQLSRSSCASSSSRDGGAAAAAHLRRAMAGLAGAEVDEVLKILFELNAQGITIIMIEHIMQAVMRFSQRVVCLDAGAIICEGTPAAIVQNPDVQAYLGA